jgi:hypothetical protein
MTTTKILKCGKNRVIKLPSKFLPKDNEVMIKDFGNALLLFSKDKHWDLFIDSLHQFSDDFFEEKKN